MDKIEFNTNKLAEEVQKRIRNTLMDLIPEAEWKELIKKEVDHFFIITDRNSYRQNRQSNFGILIQNELYKIGKEQLRTILNDYTSSMFDGNKLIVNKEIEKFIKNNVTTIFTSLIGSVIQNTINQMNDST